MELAATQFELSFNKYAASQKGLCLNAFELKEDERKSKGKISMLDLSYTFRQQCKIQLHCGQSSVQKMYTKYYGS